MTSRGILRADAVLLLVAVIFGVGFVVQKSAMDGASAIGPMSFSGIRLLMGGLVLVPFLGLGKRMRPARLASEAHQRRGMLAAGVLLAAGAILQQWGLVYTQAGVAGFVTGLYVVFVPMLGLIIGYRVHRLTWIAASLAVLGLYFLSVSGRPQLNPGDWLILAGAVCWAAQMLVIGWIAPAMDPMRLATGQNLVGGVLACAVALCLETTTLEQIQAVGWELAYSGPIAIGLAFFLQILAQRDAPPAHTAILLSMEAVFSAVAGWMFLHEHMTGVMFIGCGIVLLAMLVAQWRPPRDMPKAVALEN